MAEIVPSREEAFELLKEYNKNEALIKHALAVEAVMRYCAKKRGSTALTTGGEDEEKWGVIGLIHDLDYEQFPQEHCKKTEQILGERGWPAEYIRAVVSHGWGLCSEVKPETDLEKTLYAIDELTGLVTATALVRPSKSVLDMETNSVKKKWKDKRFAAGVNRQVIEKGAQMLGVDLWVLVADTIEGMKTVAKEIGLAGNG